ncbi:GntR family transcriptional regulator [Schaalia meyeri]|uniref:GntR family transcriptional regulator n=1 Tax=Schaalia meyeri TaxID=52773 RepID=A0AAP9Y8M4_9ACTO|nr:GntR family transcriptional regulator [Schaalia meyeri]AKU65146.1 GntR family transcriptional regulator [Schaalia meyeri]OFQ21610.1 GntR family transcriptional regulator [Actinomyces sp. HMSC062G12]QQC44160.1 GntR family transcriptional regulator [Schaalia meyeri]SDR68040.1 DNA-binding transcriptional regulator YhcF, GntR family [Schaalia meyeri]
MPPMFVSGIPIYVQIANDIRSQILRGALRDGDQLTSTTEYATTYRINPATAGKAFAILVDEGLVEKRRGIGMFVAQGAHASLVEKGLTTYVDDTLYPAVEAGLALGLDIDSIADHVRAYTANLRTKEDS